MDLTSESENFTPKMPSLVVCRDDLLRNLGTEADDKKIEDSVFDFGVELDDVYEENGRTMWKFDIPANRYDLLCLEGFSAALKGYLGIDKYKDIKVSEPKVTVVKYPTHERSHIACAVIRGIRFDDAGYHSFIDYQEKLHCSIGRNRSLLAIGTHDLEKVTGRIEYKSVDLAKIRLTPLHSEKVKGDSADITGAQLEEHFSKDKKISKFFGLLSDPLRSVAFMCDGNVMSVPPIINSERTKISFETRDIFIEVTGTDFNRVNTALKLILYNFRGEAVEPVTIRDAGENKEYVTPVFFNRKYLLSVDRVNSKLNLNLTAEDIKGFLERMMYDVQANSNDLIVNTMDVRSDIMHECDIIEDVAVAYGFNNFEKTTPEIYTVGSENPLNKFGDKIRQELAFCGYNEALTLTLLSMDENIVDPGKAAILSNPKSKEYEVVRTSLLPGILKAISSNLHGKIPIRLFEVSDVVLLSKDVDEGARNERRLCAVIAANTSLLEDIQGPLSLVFEKCGICDYKYEHCANPIYLENQSAVVKIDSTIVGTLGVIHPSVCQKFEIPYAASSFEVNLEALFERFTRSN